MRWLFFINCSLLHVIWVSEIAQLTLKDLVRVRETIFSLSYPITDLHFRSINSLSSKREKIFVEMRELSSSFFLSFASFDVSTFLSQWKTRVRRKMPLKPENGGIRAFSPLLVLA